jgi:hypothetical protein
VEEAVTGKVNLIFAQHETNEAKEIAGQSRDVHVSREFEFKFCRSRGGGRY